MAGPAYYSAIISIAMNEDWVVAFAFGSLAGDGITFVPIDLTGCILKMEIRQSEPDNQVFVSVSNDAPAGGIIITDAVNGAFTVTIDRGRLQSMVPGDYVTDLVRLLADGVTQERMFEGTANVVMGTTR